MTQQAEEKTSFLQLLSRQAGRALGFAFAFGGSVFLHAYESTLDILPFGFDRWRALQHAGKRTMAVVWHGDGLIPLVFLQQQGLSLYAGWGRDSAPPTPFQRTAREIGLAVFERFGFPVMDASRYSSEARGVIQFLRRLKGSPGAFLAPDGPSGPSEQAKDGAAFIAGKSDTVIVPIGVAMRAGVRMDTWDRFALPYPFTSATIVFGEGIEIPEEADHDMIAQCTRRIQEALVELNQQAEERLHHQSRRTSPMTIRTLTTNSPTINTG